MFSGAVNRLHEKIETVPECSRKVVHDFSFQQKQEIDLLNNCSLNLNKSNCSLLKSLPVHIEGVSAKYVNQIIINLQTLILSDARTRHLTNYVFSPVLLYIG